MRVRCLATAESTQPNEQQSNVEVSKKCPISKAFDANQYDMNFWHYKPWWCQPPSIIITGIGFVIAANVFGDCSLKTTVLACGPVLLWWYIFLVVVPTSFKEFAVEYLKTHPSDKPE